MDDQMNGNNGQLNELSVHEMRLDEVTSSKFASDGVTSEVGSSEEGSTGLSGVEETCIICHEQKTQGIRICGQFLCVQCERDIVHSDVHDRRYQHYVDEMKRIWLSALSL